jgi:hypothetical protein
MMSKIKTIALVAIAVAAVGLWTGCGQQSAAPAGSSLQAVESSVLSQVGYDAAAQELTVVFRDGGETYVYKGVSQDLYEGLVSADSIGGFYYANIRDKYTFDRR